MHNIEQGLKKWLALVLAAGMAGVAGGCAKKPAEEAAAPASAVALVPGEERSAHFDAVTRHLELGGELYGYVDVDGDVERLAEALGGLARQAVEQQPMAAAFIPADFAPFFADLGLTDVKALGFSSVESAGGGFRNRVFLHTPGGRHGLLAGLGGAAAPFAVTRLAPADADLVYETEVDGPAAYAAIRAVVARAAGEPMAAMLDQRLEQAEAGMPWTPREVINDTRGRISIVLRVDDTRTFEAGPGLVLPAFDVAIRQEHGGAKLAEVLAEMPQARREERAGGVTAFVVEREVPVLGWKPEIRIEGDSILIVSNAGFLAADEAKLADEPAFRAMLSELGEEGNGLSYVSPRLSARLGRVLELNPDQAPEQRMVVERVLAILPQADAAMLGIRQNRPDGVLFRSRWNSSLKGDLVFANPGVIAGTGLVAAMAIPAFQKVRANSQEKTVMNNLRQLGAASDQYFLETGKDSCTYADLVGTGPDKYIRELEPVAGEDYTRMVFRSGQPLRVTLANGKVVEYGNGN